MIKISNKFSIHFDNISNESMFHIQKAQNSISFLLDKKNKIYDKRFEEEILNLKDCLKKVELLNEFSEELNCLCKLFISFLDNLKNSQTYQHIYTLVTECILDFKYQCEETCYTLCSYGLVSVLAKMILNPMLTRMDELIFEFVATVSSKSKRLSNMFSTNETAFNISYLSKILKSNIKDEKYSRINTSIIQIINTYSSNITTHEEQRIIMQCFANDLVYGPKPSYCYALNGLILLIKANRIQTLNLIKLYKIDKIVKLLYDQYYNLVEENETLEYLLYFIGIYLVNSKIFLVEIESVLDLLSSQDKQIIIASSWLISNISEKFANILEDYDIGNIIWNIGKIYKSGPFIARSSLAEALLQLSKLDYFNFNIIINQLMSGLMEVVVNFYQFPELYEKATDFLYFVLIKAEEQNIAPCIVESFIKDNGNEYIYEIMDSNNPNIPPYIIYKLENLMKKIKQYL